MTGLRTKAPLSVTALRWPLVVLAVVTLVAGLVWVARGWLQVLTRLVALGWAAHLGQEQANVVIFNVACARDAACHAVLRQAWQQLQADIPWRALGVIFFGSSVGSAVAAHAARSPGIKKSPGGARWATRADLAALLKDKRGSHRRGYLGVHASGRPLRLPEQLRCAHTLVVGGTGAGKSTGYYKPNLLMDAQDGCSAVVIDVKFPDVASGLFALVPIFERAGHDVQLFLPFHEPTLRLPLLAGADESLSAFQITDILTPLKDTGGDGGFFSKQQRALLAGLILGLARQGRLSLADLVNLLLSGTQAVAEYVRNQPDLEVRQRLEGFFEQDARIRHGVVRGLVEELELFTDPRLARATTPSSDSRENVDLVSLGSRPTLLYIGIPQDELLRSRGQVLLQLVKRVLDQALIRTAAAHGGRLPVHTSIYLDEFAALGALPNIGESFATMRSRRIAYHVSLQNRAQGEAIYGRTGFASFVSGNVRQLLIFPRYLSFEDADYFSRMMGELTAVSLMTGTTRRHAFEWPNYHRRQQEVARRLLSVEEMREWPEGMAVLFQGGCPPAQVLVPRLDEPRLLRVTNPLYQSYRRLATPEVVPLAFAAALLERRCGGPSVVQERSATPEAGATTAHKAAVPDQVLLGELENSVATREQVREKQPALPASRRAIHHAFKRWFEALLAHDVPVQPQPSAYRRHETGQLIVPCTSLPPALQQDEALAAWERRGWLARHEETLMITGEGLTLLGAGPLKRVRAADQRRRARRQQATRVRVSQPPESELSAQLRAWIEQHGARLAGHPQYEALREDEKVATDLLGWYQRAAVRLPNERLKAVLKDLPKDLPAVRIGNRQGTEIPLHVLRELPELAAWCREHAHLLKGHPAFEARTDKDETEPVGRYLVEAVALPKREYQRILGHLPASTRQRDLTLGTGDKRGKRRLQVYSFAEEDC